MVRRLSSLTWCVNQIRTFCHRRLNRALRLARQQHRHPRQASQVVAQDQSRRDILRVLTIRAARMMLLADTRKCLNTDTGPRLEWEPAPLQVSELSSELVDPQQLLILIDVAYADQQSPGSPTSASAYSRQSHPSPPQSAYGPTSASSGYGPSHSG
jgi:hypothetical protein